MDIFVMKNLLNCLCVCDKEYLLPTLLSLYQIILNIYKNCFGEAILFVVLERPKITS